MRIEKPGNGLYQAKLAQDRIEVVNTNLISSTGVLSNQIDASESYLEVLVDIARTRLTRHNLYNINRFSTSSNSFVAVTGSDVTVVKNFSSTSLYASVFTRVSVDTGVGSDSTMGELVYSINGGATWLGTTPLRASWYDSTVETPAFLIYFNLGELSAGSYTFRLGIRRTLASNIYVNQISYLFSEVSI